MIRVSKKLVEKLTNGKPAGMLNLLKLTTERHTNGDISITPENLHRFNQLRQSPAIKRRGCGCGRNG
jgi:hypothetical protein